MIVSFLQEQKRLKKIKALQASVRTALKQGKNFQAYQANMQLLDLYFGHSQK
tara:strand:+ start:903 stop:1058 length:156 start_codon:yes stop_codon:yes gene_type:complete